MWVCAHNGGHPVSGMAEMQIPFTHPKGMNNQVASCMIDDIHCSHRNEIKSV